MTSCTIEIFQLFFTNELLKMIAEESNRYADQVLEKRKFNVISIKDMKAYFAFACHSYGHCSSSQSGRLLEEG